MGLLQATLDKGTAAAEKAVTGGGKKGRLPPFAIPNPTELDRAQDDIDKKIEDIRTAIQDFIKQLDTIKAMMQKNAKTAAAFDFDLDPKDTSDQKAIKSAHKILADCFNDIDKKLDSRKKLYNDFLAKLPK